MLTISGNILPFEHLNFHVFFRDTLYWALLPKNNLKLFVLLNYSSSFWYSNTIRIVFPERVITWYSVHTDLIFEYIFSTWFVQKIGIRSNSEAYTQNHEYTKMDMGKPIRVNTGCSKKKDISVQKRRILCNTLY